MRYRYKYSHEHLDFIKVRKSFWKLAGHWSLYFLGSVALAIGYYVLFSTFFHTPEERGLLRENKMLTEQYISLITRFNQLETVLDDISHRDSVIYRTIFQADPLSVNPRLGIGGTNRYADLETFNNASIVRMTDLRLKDLTARANMQAISLDTITMILQRKEIEFAHLPAIQPIKNKDLTRTGASIGMRIHPYYKVLKMHTGIDFVAATGIEVIAAADGMVTNVDRSYGHGNKVEIDHGSGYTTLYAHLHTIDVKKGQKVKRGQMIATVGNTGMSMAPHLHYEVLKDGEHKDPLNFFFLDLNPEEYERMIQLAANSGQSLD